VDYKIADSQVRTVAPHFPLPTLTSDGRKQPFESPINSGGGDSITTTLSVSSANGSRRGSVASSSSSFFSSHRMFQGQGGSQQPPPQQQMMLCGNQISPNASQVAHIAAANFLISCGLPFSLSEDPKFMRIFEVGRNLGPNYKPPDH
jgi:hypothetical protein